MKTPGLIVLCVAFPAFVSAQDTTRISSQDVIEDIVNDAADEQDLRQFVEELEYLQQHPESYQHLLLK